MKHPTEEHPGTRYQKSPGIINLVEFSTIVNNACNSRQVLNIIAPPPLAIDFKIIDFSHYEVPQNVAGSEIALGTFKTSSTTLPSLSLI